MKNKVTNERKPLIVFLWVLFLGILIQMIFLFLSCSQPEQQSEPIDNSTIPQKDMFKVIYKDNMLRYHVVYDIETNVEYIVSNVQGNRGTFTMRVDSTGKPKLYKH